MTKDQLSPDALAALHLNPEAIRRMEEDCGFTIEVDTDNPDPDVTMPSLIITIPLVGKTPDDLVWAGYLASEIPGPGYMLTDGEVVTENLEGVSCVSLFFLVVPR